MHPYAPRAYAPRAMAFHGVRTHGDWRLKLYSIVYGDGGLDEAAFAPGLRLAFEALPHPAVTPRRPGLGFVILHQGRTGNYTVLAWWDQENELPLRVFVCQDGEPGHWRCNRGSESICVWDLEIIGAERNAYVECLLTTAGAGAAGYLESDATRP